LIKKISIIGAGNVATHLGESFVRKGFSINQIFSKSLANASLLASKLNADACNSIAQLNSDSDVYLICIKDDFIENIANHFTFTDKLVIHTSGSVAMSVLNQFDNYGIFYPLQTFSINKEVDMNEVPFCIEANNKESEQLLIGLGNSLSKSVQLVNSDQRKQIHLAAVFACNFSNYMYSISENILSKNNIDFNILKPLIIETAKKIQHNSARSMQTGPAKRNDDAVIKNHIKMLAESSNYQDIYKIITDNIIKDN